jgi:hypothetical protein
MLNDGHFSGQKCIKPVNHLLPAERQPPPNWGYDES